jgi:hypothetical protein
MLSYQIGKLLSVYLDLLPKTSQEINNNLIDHHTRCQKSHFNQFIGNLITFINILKTSPLFWFYFDEG